MPTTGALRVILMLAASGLAGCATLEANQQGPLQPQSVSGPCQVPRFFFLGQRAAPAQMTITNNGQACTFVLINPALNAVVDAALVSTPAAHGQASAGLISGNRQAAVSYTPAPGYAGPDKFTVTLEPNNFAIAVTVTVQPGR